MHAHDMCPERICLMATSHRTQVLAEHCPKRLRHVTVAGAGNGLVTRQVWPPVVFTVLISCMLH